MTKDRFWFWGKVLCRHAYLREVVGDRQAGTLLYSVDGGPVMTVKDKFCFCLTCRTDGTIYSTLTRVRYAPRFQS